MHFWKHIKNIEINYICTYRILTTALGFIRQFDIERHWCRNNTIWSVIDSCLWNPPGNKSVTKRDSHIPPFSMRRFFFDHTIKRKALRTPLFLSKSLSETLIKAPFMLLFSLVISCIPSTNSLWKRIPINTRAFHPDLLYVIFEQ